MTEEHTPADAVELATELTIAWLSNPNTRAQASEIPEFLRTMHEAVSGLGISPEQHETSDTEAQAAPAVTVRKSLASRDHILSLIDGKPYKTLRRHLSQNGMTPEEYRKRYGLKSDYPMVAPAYAERRRELAKAIGLGQKGKRRSAGEAKANGSAAPRQKRTPKT